MRYFALVMFSVIALSNAWELASDSGPRWARVWDALGLVLGIGGLVWVWAKWNTFDEPRSRRNDTLGLK